MNPVSAIFQKPRREQQCFKAELEQLDLLLLTVSKPRRVQQDGIHFQGFRYIDLTLAAYVGEDVTIRYDARDLGGLRVYFGDSFLCRAINPELSGETVALKDVIRLAIGAVVNSGLRSRTRSHRRGAASAYDVVKNHSQRRSFRSRRRRAQRR